MCWFNIYFRWSSEHSYWRLVRHINGEHVQIESWVNTRSQSCWLIIQVPWLIVTTHSFIVSLTSISCFFPRCNYPARSGFSSWFHTYIIDNITYIYVSPHQDLPMCLFHWLFHCKVNHLLFAIWKKNNKHQKTTKKTMHWRAFSPPPIPKCVTQNVSFCSLVVVFLIFVGFVQD